MLLNPMLQRADDECVAVYLEASPAGAPMYPKFGFRKVLDFAWLDGTYVTEYHVRPAKKANC